MAQENSRPSRILICVNTKDHTKGTLLRGLEGIHSESAEAHVDMTWSEFFRQGFNVELDPLRYSVRKACSGAQLHSLNETIAAWLPEFIKPNHQYVVQVVELKKPMWPRSVPPATSTKRATTPRAISGPRQCNLACCAGSTTSVHHPSPGAGIRREEVNRGDDAGLVSPQTTLNASVVPNRGRMSSNSSLGSVSTSRPSSSFSEPNGRRSLPQDNARMEVDNQRSEGNHYGEVIILDDDDAQSQCSEDGDGLNLAGQGQSIRTDEKKENFKPIFVQNLKEKFRNSQLVQARDALYQLKHSKDKQKWTNYGMACPEAFVIMEALFDL